MVFVPQVSLVPKTVLTIDAPHDNIHYINDLIEFHKGKILLSCGNDSTIKAWCVSTGALQFVVTSPSPARSIIKWNSTTVVTNCSDNCIRVWRIEQKVQQCVLTFPTVSIVWSLLRLRHNPLHPVLVCGMWSGAIELRRLTDYALLQSLEGHKNIVSCITELADGTIISSSYDRTIRRWNLDSTNHNSNIQTFKGHTSSVRNVVELKPHLTIASCALSEIKIWCLTTATCLKTFHSNNGQDIWLLRLSDETLISSTSDQKMVLWNVDNEEDPFEIARFTYITTMIHPLELRNGYIAFGTTSRNVGSQITQNPTKEGQVIQIRDPLTSVGRKRCRHTKSLTEKCTKVVGINRNTYPEERLKQFIPDDLVFACLLHRV